MDTHNFNIHLNHSDLHLKVILDSNNPPYSIVFHIIPTYICTDMIADDVRKPTGDMTLALRTKSGTLHD